MLSNLSNHFLQHCYVAKLVNVNREHVSTVVSVIRNIVKSIPLECAKIVMRKDVKVSFGIRLCKVKVFQSVCPFSPVAP